MGLLATLEGAVRGTRGNLRFSSYTAAGVYAVLVGCTAALHEPWADEAQSWLLARDAGLVELWTRLLHYEGTPGLWHTLLHGLVNLGMPYQGLKAVSVILGLLGAWLVLGYSPFPPIVRLLLPFTFYLGYQYAVVARSYDLLPVLVFAGAIAYGRGVRSIGVLAVLLCLIASVSLQGFVLSAAIWAAWHLQCFKERHTLSAGERKQLLIAAVAYSAVLALLAASAWPAPDVTFVRGMNWSASHFSEVSAATVRYAFTGEWITTLAALALSLPFLHRGRALVPFLLAALLLCVIGSIVYTHVWHFGVVFLAWVFALWVAASRTEPPLYTVAAILVVCSVQLFWTVQSSRYDWANKYSGGAEAARYLREARIPRAQLYGIGFTSAGLQPYFPTNIFANFHEGGDRAYWDWSVRNHNEDARELFAPGRPEYLMVGYKASAEKQKWAALAGVAGYRISRHFEGNLFWRTKTLEPSSFDLYHRQPGAAPGNLASSLSVGAAHSESQLLSGFHGSEDGKYRWTAREFSVVLRAPADARERGGQLKLHLFIPDGQIRKLGPMTLSAEVEGRRLPPRTYTQGGQFVFDRPLPVELLASETVVVTFAFDKAAPPEGAEQRELAAVVTAVAIEKQ